MTSQNLHIGPDAAADRYRLLRSIGRGGEAVLYLAEIELAGGSEPVVVKVLDSKTTITPDVFDRISQKWNEQAELLRFVHRPGVVGVREHFEGPPIHRPGESSTLTGRALVLVMNHVDGLDLRDWRAERTLATAAERREVMRTLEQLADVLDWLHSGKATPSGRQVIHGDLSPGNVMVDEHGQATLVDFGLSKLTADHQTAEVWFTPGYAAPEVFDGKRTPGTDRYAFGAIAYFLLSGESPPATAEQLAHALAALPQIAALDAEQRARITSIYAADPGKRPVNLAGWMKDVRHAVVSTTTSTSQRVVQDTPPRPAAPPVSVVPPQPATPPPVAAQPTTPPPVAAQPVSQPPVSQPPVSQPPAAPPPAAYVPTAAATVPDPGPDPATVPAQAPLPESVPAGYGPTYHLNPAPAPMPAPVPAPEPPRPKKRRTGLILGSAAAVLVLAALAVAGVQLLGDKDKDKSGGVQAGGSTPSAGGATSAPADPMPSASRATPSDPPGSGSGPSGSPGPSDPGTAPASNVADLTNLQPIDGLNGLRVEAATLNTKSYGSSFIADCSQTSSAEFNLNRAWSQLEFTAGIADNSPVERGRISVSIDDQPALFNEEVVLGKPVSKTVEVKGALRLRIRVEDTCGLKDGYVVLASPTLKR
ncbi:serine/threonine protein kinase [Streptomyces sp. NBC_01294]|uniref:serine/threonine protein kinase n=1 Tax=Streptomyces sp. NBC_01294 TaxID=2903815 RepID=UPI002DDA7D3D|nr:serine/threonine-protein kinase [Streptomyces sp. NBC_01294]WRZ56938.1 serine/threonine protein kinase [Streptomyces sp. NBC_01294]